MLQWVFRDELRRRNFAFRVVRVLLGALMCVWQVGNAQDLMPKSVLQPVLFSANSMASGAVGLLFADGFENGDTLAWSATHTGATTVMVFGTLTDAETGLPLEGIEIQFFDQSDEALNVAVQTLITGADGTFEGEIASGAYFIGAYPPAGSDYARAYFPGVPPYYDPTGWEGWKPTSIAGAAVDLSFLLFVGGKIEVQLFGSDGNPYTGALVPQLHSLGDGACGSGCIVGTYYLDLTSGFVETPIVPPGDYLLTILPDMPLQPQYYCGAFEVGDAEVIHLQSGEVLRLSDCMLTVRPTVNVTGQVTSDQGVPIGGVAISFLPHSGTTTSFFFTTDSTGTFAGTVHEGEFFIEYRPPEESGFSVVHYPGTPPYYNPTQLGWESIEVSAENNRFDVVIPPGARIRVSINSPDGTPNAEPINPYLYYVRTSPREPVDWVGNEGTYDLEIGTSDLVSPWVLPGDYVLGLFFYESVTIPPQFYCGTLAEELAEIIHLDPGDDLVLPACTLVSSRPVYTISGRVTDDNGDPVADVQVIAEPQSTDAVEVVTLTGEDGTYVLEAAGSYHSVQALPDPSTWLAGEWYPDAYCDRYVDVNLFWHPMFTYLSSGQNYTDIDFELERGGVIELEGLLGGDQMPVGEPVTGAFTYLRRTGEIDEYREDHYPGNYTQICRNFETDDMGRLTSPVLPEHKYLMTFGFRDAEAGYINQGYCRVADQQSGDLITVVVGETTMLPECELITDEYQLRTSEGTMFSFDEHWSSDVGWLYGYATAGDLDNDGLQDFVLAGVGDAHGSDCPPGTTFGTGIMVFINQGGNHFEDQTEHWTAELDFGFCNGLFPRIADLDGNGFPDLVLVGSSVEWTNREWGQQDEVWRNVDGDHFESKTGDWIPLDEKPGADGFLSGYFELGDLDADGDIDLVRTMDSEGGQILLNDGSGRLVDVTIEQNQIDSGVIPRLNPATWGIDLADINVDGSLDILFVEHDGEASHLRAMLGRGDGFFEIPEPDGLLATPFPGDWIEDHADLEAVDLDGDGLPEIYLALELLMSSECIEYYVSAVCRTNELDRLFSVTSVDDGFPTLIDVNDRLEQSASFNKSHRVRSADIDNDGDIDLVVSNFAFGADQFTHPEIRVLINDGFGNMSLLEKEAFPSFTASAGDVEIFDSDNDGDLDLLLCGSPVVLLVNKTVSPE